MPSKSRRKRGKHSFQGKKKKGMLTHVPTTAEQPVATQTYAPAAPSPTTAPPASAPTPTSQTAVAGYHYVPSELKRIGILAGIMIAVLVILSRVLS
jgi:hypothetical protein